MPWYIFFWPAFFTFWPQNAFFGQTPLSFWPASTFCFPTEPARFGILILTNSAEIQCRNHALTRTGPISEPGVQSRTDGTPGQSWDTGLSSITGPVQFQNTARQSICGQKTTHKIIKRGRWRVRSRSGMQSSEEDCAGQATWVDWIRMLVV